MEKEILENLKENHYYIDDIDVSHLINNKEKLLIQMISQKDGIPIEESYQKYIVSNICQKLRDPYTGIFTTAVELLYEDFKNNIIESKKEK